MGAFLGGLFGVILGLILMWITPGITIASGGFIVAIPFGGVAALAGWIWGYKLAPKPNTLYRRVWELVSVEEIVELGPRCVLEPPWEWEGAEDQEFNGWVRTTPETAVGEPMRCTMELPVNLSPDVVTQLEATQTAEGWWWYRHLYPLKYTYLHGEDFVDEPTAPAAGGLAVMLGTEDIYGTAIPFQPETVRATFMWETLQQRVDKALWGLQAGNLLHRVQMGVAVAVAIGVVLLAAFMTIATAEPPKVEQGASYYGANER